MDGQQSPPGCALMSSGDAGGHLSPVRKPARTSAVPPSAAILCLFVSSDRLSEMCPEQTALLCTSSLEELEGMDAHVSARLHSDVIMMIESISVLPFPVGNVPFLEQIHQ